MDTIVINTEAHIFPRFNLVRGLKTGWERKPRDKDGKILEEKGKGEEKVKEKKDQPEEGPKENSKKTKDVDPSSKEVETKTKSEEGKEKYVS